MKSTRIHNLLEQKRGKDRDIVDTAKTIGQWYKSSRPGVMKPGQQGYVRPRNVPPEGGQYENPEHDAYARNSMHWRIHNMGAHQFGEPKLKGSGKLHDLAKERDDARTKLRKSGTDELERHGVKPVVRRWSAGKPGEKPRIVTAKK